MLKSPTVVGWEGLGCCVSPPQTQAGVGCPRYLSEEGERLVAGGNRVPRMAVGDLGEGLLLALGDRRWLSRATIVCPPPEIPGDMAVGVGGGYPRTSQGTPMEGGEPHGKTCPLWGAVGTWDLGGRGDLNISGAMSG